MNDKTTGPAPGRVRYVYDRRGNCHRADGKLGVAGWVFLITLAATLGPLLAMPVIALVGGGW